MFKPAAKSSKTLATYQATREIQRPVSEAVRALKNQARGLVNIRWNSRTGSPRSIRGGLTQPGEGSAQEIARQFLAEHHELFGFREDLADLRYLRTTELRGVRHVRFQQVFHGFPVFGAELNVHIDQADRVQMVNGEYCPGIDLDPAQNLISKVAAINTVLLHLEMEGPSPPDARADLVVFPKGDSYCLAYCDI
jgi:thermolysin/neutral peptidase B